MQKPLEEELRRHRNELYPLFQRYLHREQRFLLRSELIEELNALLAERNDASLSRSPLVAWLQSAQEAAVHAPFIFFSVRPGVGNWHYLRVHAEEMYCREISVSEFLLVKEKLVDEHQQTDDWILELDLTPFERGFPRLKESRSIGRGVEFLNRHLSRRLFDGEGKGHQRLLEFMKVHQYRGEQLMLARHVATVEELQAGLRTTTDFLHHLPPETEWEALKPRLPVPIFEPGWGRTAAQVLESMNLLLDILEAPDPKTLEEFLARMPMIFAIVILSPHGYFSQSRVLGKPDTGGQVVYILDQVRALEKQMREDIYQQGLRLNPQIILLTRLIPEAGDTTCNERLEPIHGTQHARILRVPFRNEAGEILPQWISRFELWPYLESFTKEAEKELLAELGGRPDFIIGNYSDGNLVAALLSQRLNITQCNIAHALEKPKYLHSDLYWQDHEREHHFACQFTADLISMNTADFIITSTYQEIAGTRESAGQYESYRSFTLPGLYRVLRGVDVFDPKFNIVSPGADSGICFPCFEQARRGEDLRRNARQMVHGHQEDGARGLLADREKPVLFVMSRLDYIKNVTGMLEWYARSQRLRQLANLFVVGGYLDPNRSRDAEEQYQIETMHRLMDEYELDPQVRWVPMQTEKTQVGALYRYIAEVGGAFVQPALFEAFGLTVIEAMASGLPTFATRYGGPLEIIEDGVSGFHIDPNHGDAATERMAAFFERCAAKPGYWKSVSDAGIQRVQSRYTWKRYAQRLLALSRVYGFWKYISNIEREETRRYLEMFYGLMFRPLARRLLQRETAGANA